MLSKIEKKVVVLGTAESGKTGFCERLTRDIFDSKYTSTIGANYFTKTVNEDKKPIKLGIWDTAGQERFRSLLPMYIRGSDVIIYTVNLSTETLNTEQIINDLTDYQQEDLNRIIILAGTFNDLENNPIQLQHLEELKNTLATEHDLTVSQIFMTSAKTGQGYQELETWLTEEILKSEVVSFEFLHQELQSSSDIYVNYYELAKNKSASNPQLSNAFDNFSSNFDINNELPKKVKNGIFKATYELLEKLTDSENDYTLEDKQQHLETFKAECLTHLEGSLPWRIFVTICKAVTLFAAIVTGIIAGAIIGFTLGVMLGMPLGPEGSFTIGLTVALLSATLAGGAIAGWVGPCFFAPSDEMNRVNEFAETVLLDNPMASDSENKIFHPI